MAQRTVRVLTDMEIDEVSLVDRPANQHAKVAIAKRAPEEDTMPEYVNQAGEVVDLDSLQEGDIVFDAEGNAFEFVLEDEPAAELETVGKSLADSVREDLSKALSDIERDEVISKALGEVSKAEQRAAAAEAVAKAERDLRLTREYVAKAAEYGVPVPADELGPVLMRAAENLSYEDCAVIHKALTAAGQAFAELGTAGQGTNLDPYTAVEALIGDEVTKSDGSREAVIAKAFADNPRLYDEYLASRPGR